jgi:hypothetical protein
MRDSTLDILLRIYKEETTSLQYTKEYIQSSIKQIKQNSLHKGITIGITIGMALQSIINLIHNPY